MATQQRRATRMGAHQGEALPLGRRVPRGRLRWYLVKCPEGREQVLCQRLRQLAPAELLNDAFVPRIERVFKTHGEWTVSERALFGGYFVIKTTDAGSLSRFMAKSTLPLSLAGEMGRGFAPMDERTCDFLASCMDATHVIRSSEAEIVSDELHVLRGPLVGKESRVSRYDRHKSFAVVDVGDGAGSFSLCMPLTIPVRR